MKWIKMGWGHDLKGEQGKDLFAVNFSAMKPTGYAPLEAAVMSVYDIIAKYPAPHTLMLSGGVDSQAMLWAWKKSGVKFDTLSVRYTDDSDEVFNEHDLLQLKEFARMNDIQVNFIDFNIIDFLENNLSEYVEKYQCTSPQICTHMRLSEMVQGTAIFSGNHVSKQHTHLNYTILGLHRYAETSGRSIVPFFFMHTPELGWAFANGEQKPHGTDRVTGYELKYKMYQAFGFPVIPQGTKMTGFELIKDYYDEKNSKTPLVSFKEKTRFGRLPSKRVFDLVFRYSNSLKVKYEDKLLIQFNPINTQ